MFFKQKISQNVYGELVPEDGKYDYTIILSGHTDTSWNWKHSENASKYPDKPIYGLITTYGKVGFGAVCVFFLVGLSVAMATIYTGLYFDASWAYIAASSDALNKLIIALHFLPLITAIGSCFVIMWNDSDEENASKGAMDNATGCALSYAVIKYFKENPDKMPKNCRIVDFNCGSEEAGLRGSMNFAHVHRNDDLTKNAWNINIDSVADKEYFEVVIKDDSLQRMTERRTIIFNDSGFTGLVDDEIVNIRANFYSDGLSTYDKAIDGIVNVYGYICGGEEDYLELQLNNACIFDEKYSNQLKTEEPILQFKLKVDEDGVIHPSKQIYKLISKEYEGQLNVSLCGKLSKNKGKLEGFLWDVSIDLFSIK